MAKKSKTKENPTDKKSLVGRKFRFVVNSAENAARIIRERLGESAKVLSVKQVNGKGLARFLTSPQLEIIVTVPLPEEEGSRKKEKEEKGGRQASEGKAFAEVLEKSNESREWVGNEVTERVNKPIEVEKKPEERKTVKKERMIKNEGSQSLEKLLERSGFDTGMIAALKLLPQWNDLRGKAVSNGLAEVMVWLREQYASIGQKGLSTRTAFFGAPGVGTTTALCKYLSNEVFVNNKAIQVLKIENERPNSNDGLKVFCDVLGVDLLRDSVDLERLDTNKSLYIDPPGIMYQEKEEWVALKERLDVLKVDSRVLVINAAYDKVLIRDAFKLGDCLRATHIVFTHMDEVLTYAKMWPFILQGGLPTLFLSCGQSIANDIEKDVLDYMLERSFPSMVIN